MSTRKPRLVIVGSRGLDDERSTVTLTVANGAHNAGFDVTLFLVASGVDLVRKGAIDDVRMNPFDPPMKEMMDTFLEKGGQILACPPCAKVRGYDADALIDGVTIVGSGAMHELIQAGASTLCF